MNGKTVNLQIPISKELKIAAQKSALEMGFSSLQETLRVFLNELAEKRMMITFMPKIHISSKADKRYRKIAEKIERGIGVYEINNVNDLMKQLNK